MAGNTRRNRALTGGWGEVQVDGEEIFVFQKIGQKAGVNHEDAQMGMNVDSRAAGLKGSGTLSIKKVYSGVKVVLEKLSAGQNTRCQIIAKLEGPDAVDGQMECWSTDDVRRNTIPVINWETGEQIQEGWEFGFTLSDVKNLNEVEQDGGIGKRNRIKGVFLNVF